MDDSVAEGHGRVVGVREIVAEKEDAGGLAAGVGLREVGGVGVDVENHVPLVISDGGYRVRGSVVEKFGYFCHGVGCRL